MEWQLESEYYLFIHRIMYKGEREITLTQFKTTDDFNITILFLENNRYFLSIWKAIAKLKTSEWLSPLYYRSLIKTFRTKNRWEEVIIVSRNLAQWTCCWKESQTKWSSLYQDIYYKEQIDGRSVKHMATIVSKHLLKGTDRWDECQTQWPSLYQDI